MAEDETNHRDEALLTDVSPVSGAAVGRRGWINLLVAVYWIAMFTGTHIPNPEAIIGPEVSDKLLHFAAYFVLMALLIGRDRLLTAQWPGVRRLGGWLLLLIGYAAADELLQAVPGINRHADVQDALADVAGAVAAATVAFLWAAVPKRTRTRGAARSQRQ